MLEWIPIVPADGVNDKAPDKQQGYGEEDEVDG